MATSYIYTRAGKLHQLRFSYVGLILARKSRISGNEKVLQTKPIIAVSRDTQRWQLEESCATSERTIALVEVSHALQTIKRGLWSSAWVKIRCYIITLKHMKGRHSLTEMPGACLHFDTKCPPELRENPCRDIVNNVWALLIWRTSLSVVSCKFFDKEPQLGRNNDIQVSDHSLKATDLPSWFGLASVDRGASFTFAVRTTSQTPSGKGCI